MEFKKILEQTDFSIVHYITSSAYVMHFHPEYAIGYYFGGRGSSWFSLSGQLDFHPGEIALLNPGETHEDFALGTKRECLLVKINKELFRELISEAGGIAGAEPYFSSPKVQAAPRMRMTFDFLREEMNGQQFGRVGVIKSLVTELSFQLLRQFSQFGFQREKPNLAHWRIRRAVEYLSEAYTQEFDLSRVSEAAGLSKYYLDRVFKEATGLSPRAYVMRLRFEKAKELLASSSKKIVEISLDLGFSDQSHFTNAFKRFTSVTPQAYRLATNWESSATRINC